MSSRRYTEKESAEIIRKAAENQAASSGGQGVTEGELRSAAQELGIELTAINTALAEIDIAAQPKGRGFWGGPFQHETEVVFDGTLSDEKWEDVLADIRRAFGEPGTVEQRGTTMEWVGTSGGLETNTVTIRQTGKTVRIKAIADWSGVAVISYLLLILPMFLSVGLLVKLAAGPIVSTAIWFAIMGAAIVALRHVLGSASKRTAAKVNHLVRRTQGMLAVEETGTAEPDLKEADNLYQTAD